MRADDGRVVSNFIGQLLSGEELTIYGDGSQTRCFCFVDDTVDGLIRLMDSDSAVGVPVNLGDPDELSIRDLAERLVQMTGGAMSLAHRALPQDDPRRRKPDISRAIELLGWRPTVKLDQGLAKTIAWFEDERAYADEPLVATAAE
jgi:UDP-glucuronate decarboxylase